MLYESLKRNENFKVKVANSGLLYCIGSYGTWNLKKVKPFAIVDLNSCLIFSQKHVSKCNYGVIIIGLGPDLELEICRE